MRHMDMYPGVCSLVVVCVLFPSLVLLGCASAPGSSQVVTDKLVQRAIAGDADAQLKLGQHYYSGKGVTQSYPDAYSWFSKAADQGNLPAIGNLCYMNMKGEGTPLDYGKARAACERGVAKGDAVSESYLAAMYDEGYGVPKDYDKALSLYLQAAEQGNVYGERAVCQMYYWGYGTRRDYAVATNWLHQAAAQGDPIAEYLLGRMYYYGHGMSKDYKEAAVFYARAAEKGLTEAEIDLAGLYTSGHGVDKDRDKAVALLEKALAQGNPLAGCRLARMHFYDGDPAVDDARAMQLFDAGVKIGDRECMNAKSWLLSTTSKTQLRDPVTATALAKQALEHDPGFWSFMDTLAAAYASEGRFDLAMDEEQSALAKIPTDPDHAEERDKLAKRLALFTDGIAYTDPTH